MEKLLMAINKAQEQNLKSSRAYDDADLAWHRGHLDLAAILRKQAGEEYQKTLQAWESVERIRFGIPEFSGR